MLLFSNKIYSTDVKIKAALLLLAISLNALEFFFPRIPLFPWLKPGIANIVTIVIIIRYGFREAILFSLLRIWIVAFYFGFSFLTTTLALSGSLLAITVMSIAYKIGKEKVGFVGISVFGAIFHNIGQLSSVYLILSKNQFIFYQIPVMLIIATITGTINGLLASFLFKSSQNIINEKLYNEEGKQWDIKELQGSPNILISIVLFFFCSSLILISNLKLLISFLIIITLIVQIILKFDIKPIVLPLKRFWLIFAAIACMNLFYTYGKVIPKLPFITYEGLFSTLTQWTRIYTWLQVTYLFLHFRSHLLIFDILKKNFPNNGSMLAAGIESIEYFPLVLDMVRKNSKYYLTTLFKSPSRVLSELLESMINLQNEEL